MKRNTDIVRVSLLLTLNGFHTLFWCFHYWLWATIYQLRTLILKLCVIKIYWIILSVLLLLHVHIKTELLQAPFYVYKDTKIIILGHGFVLHSLVRSAGPLHSIPPCAGVGLLHLLVLTWLPLPHDFEHFVYGIQLDQPPLTLT